MKIRNIRIDLMKFISLFLICLIHFFQRFYANDGYLTSIFFAVPYSVCLGLFFFSGAYFIKRADSLKSLLWYIGKTLVTYLLPAYLFSCLSILTLKSYSGHDFGFWMESLYKGTETFYWYFLTACFFNIFIAIIYYLASLIFKEPSLKHRIYRCIIVLVSLLGYMWIFISIYNHWFTGLGPKCLSADMFLYYLPIVFIGFLFGEFHEYVPQIKEVKTIRLVSIICCSVVYLFIVIVYRNNWLKGLSGNFLDIFYRDIATICGTIAIYLSLSYIENITMIKKVSALGMYSGPFYLLHVYFIRLIYENITLPSSYLWWHHPLIVLGALIFFAIMMIVTILLVKFPYTDALLFAHWDRVNDFSHHFQRKTVE